MSLHDALHGITSQFTLTLHNLLHKRLHTPLRGQLHDIT